MSASLEQRISSALGDGAITSADLADLIAEVDKAAAAAAAKADAERAKALDVTQPVDLATAHAAMEQAAMSGERLRAAMPRLWSRFDEVTSLEYADKRRFRRGRNRPRCIGGGIARNISGHRRHDHRPHDPDRGMRWGRRPR